MVINNEQSFKTKDKGQRKTTNLMAHIYGEGLYLRGKTLQFASC